MNVLSLFDGMSCGQIALQRSKINVDSYCASEIKPHAIKVTQHNFPNTIQLGDVRNIHVTNLGIEVDESKSKMRVIGRVPDLLIGGSPCQDLSRANQKRDGLEGIKSGLFYQYLRIFNQLRLVNPKFKFLLENVVMSEADYWIISKYLGVLPININSDLVSAQKRDRLYWTNIGLKNGGLFNEPVCGISQPKNKKITLQSILTSGFTDRLKSTCVMEGWSRPNSIKSQERMWNRHKKGFTTYIFEDESLNWRKGIRYINQTELERLQTVPEGYTSLVNRNDAACLLGDGWTIDVISHIFNHLK